MRKISGLILAGVIFINVSMPGQAEEYWRQQIKLQSSAFEDRGTIPSDFTCDGADMSPPIEWSGVPANVGSFAIIADDPDAPAGNWVHWLVYDLPSSLTQLPAGIPMGESLSAGGLQGRNDFGSIGCRSNTFPII